MSPALSYRHARHVSRGSRSSGHAYRPCDPPVDQLEPLRGRRVRRAQRVAGNRTQGGGRLRRTWRDDQHRRLRQPSSTRTEAGRPRDGAPSVPVHTNTASAAWLGCSMLLFEEADRVLLCSDLLHQLGDVEPTTTGDIADRYRHALETYQASPSLVDYVPPPTTRDGSSQSWHPCGPERSPPCTDPRSSATAPPPHCERGRHS